MLSHLNYSHSIIPSQSGCQNQRTAYVRLYGYVEWDLQSASKTAINRSARRGGRHMVRSAGRTEGRGGLQSAGGAARQSAARGRVRRSEGRRRHRPACASPPPTRSHGLGRRAGDRRAAGGRPPAGGRRQLHRVAGLAAHTGPARADDGGVLGAAAHLAAGQRVRHRGTAAEAEADEAAEPDAAPPGRGRPVGEWGDTEVERERERERESWWARGHRRTGEMAHKYRRKRETNGTSRDNECDKTIKWDFVM